MPVELVQDIGRLLMLLLLLLMRGPADEFCKGGTFHLIHMVMVHCASQVLPLLLEDLNVSG